MNKITTFTHKLNFNGKFEMLYLFCLTYMGCISHQAFWYFIEFYY